MGFAIVAPGFNLDTERIDYSSFQSMALLLMTSRLLLMLQYATILLFTWKYERVRLPLGLKMWSLTIAAFIYLGLYFDFDGNHGYSGHIALYLVAILEALGILIVPSQHEVLGFQFTCIVERVGLLTLIILGEGIIGVSQATLTISRSHFYDPPTFFGVTVSAILIIVSRGIFYSVESSLIPPVFALHAIFRPKRS